jgi:hypothetical protein
MISLRFTDRMALVAMSAATVAIALASAFTAPGAHAAAKPSASITLPDGTLRRFYTTGPFGTETFREDVSPDGKVSKRRQVLDDEVFAGIAPGMLASEVFARLGPPYRKARFEWTKTTAWDYHYAGPWSNDADLSVIVDDAGVVVARIMTRNTD